MSSQITLLPDYVSFVQNTSLDFYLKSTNLLNALGSYLAEIEENIKFNKSLVTTDMLSSYGVLYNTLNETNFTIENFKVSNDKIETNGVKSLNNSFKLFFIEKYQSLSKEYKERVNTLINNNNYFTDFSDDIGYITDPPSVLDNNVLPYYDVFNQQYFYSQNVPNTINKKISIDEKIMLKTFSFYTDSLLRLNLVGLQEGNITENTARTAHGQNLITDVLYYNRSVLNQQAFLSEIQVILGDISNFILFFKDLNPRDKNPENKAILTKYTITNMENLEVKVDVLKNNLTKLALSSKVVLGV